MRTKKKAGFWKIHQNCGVCQKPKRYRKETILKELGRTIGNLNGLQNHECKFESCYGRHFKEYYEE